MKKFLFLIAVALATLQLSAADVSPLQAQNAANAFLNRQMRAGTLKASNAANLKLVKAEASVARPTAVDYYIFNAENAYVVVAGDDDAPQILMYSENGTIDLDNIPPAMQWLLNKYKYQIDGLKAGTMVPVKAPNLNATAVPPLVTANWDQTKPYYNHTPTSGSTHAYTGCPATSLAMCFYLYKWPATYPALPAIASNSYYGYLAAPALSEKAADWDNMIDEYTGPSNYSYTSAQAEAVSWLMRYVGQACNMGYSTSGSGATDPEILEACHTFGYTDAQLLTLTEIVQSGWSGYTNSSQNYTDAQWNEWMLNELYNGRPIEYLACDITGNQVSGHAFNVFGCNSSGQYYVNWGWSGDSNGYCTLHNFTTATGATGQSGSYTFKYGEAMIIGIAPPGGSATTPELNVDPTSLSFTDCSTGGTYTKTFTVSGTDLSGSVNISSSNSTFTVSPSTLTAAQAQAGATITVTYKPTAAGTQSGNITVSSTGASSKTVTVSGTATATPTITVNPTSLSLSTTAGTAVSQTFTLTGTNLTGTVYLSCTGTGFSIDKSNITKNAAAQGATITVTYHPTAAGTHTGSVTITSSGAQTVTLPLTGTAVGVPTIVADPTSLSFNTTVGQPVTKTFTVTGTDLTGSVSLAVTGTGFSIDKNTISKNQATNGSTVTVTYNPTAGGSSNGTVTLTSSGAQAVTVSLSGIATTVPTITANPTTLNFQTTVGTPVTNSFVINAANLEGDVNLAVEGEGFAIDKNSLTANAANGSTVTVTYTPTAFGTHTGTVTITSANVQPVTVTLNGQADLVKYAPVMLPADEAYINLTKFRADWTDQTPADNVESYTLEVSAKPELPTYELLSSVAGTDFTGSATGYYSITLPYPWSGQNVRGGLNSVIYFRNNYNNDGSYGNISYTVPAGYENATFTMKITTATTSDGSGSFMVSTPQTNGVTRYLNAGETSAWVVKASAGEKILITTDDDQYSADIALLEVYSGDASVANLRANETGDATYRLITGITDKFYTVEDLTAEGTFLYKVKALYLDGTESEWSNVEEVTLFQNGHGYAVGDVDHDGVVAIADVSVLTDYLLNGTGDVCLICADVDADGVVGISDVSELIDRLLGNSSAMMKAKKNRVFNPNK